MQHHLEHGIVRKHRILVRITVRIDDGRGPARVVRDRFGDHRGSGWRRSDVRNLGSLHDHVVLRLQRRGTFGGLVVAEPASGRCVTQFDGTTVNDATHHPRKKRALSIHLLQRHFGFVARSELDEAEPFAYVGSRFAHNLALTIIGFEYFCAAERNVFLFEYLIQLCICHAGFQLSNVHAVVVRQIQILAPSSEVQAKRVSRAG